MALRLAQTFYIDKTSVRDAENVSLTSIDVFFKQKPLERSNKSGIAKPGVTLYIMETRDDDVPNTSRVLENGSARLEYDSIVASTNASIVSTFRFARPLIVKTNRSYAIGISYDGDEDYELWTCKEGELVVGTNMPTSGSTTKSVGSYYQYSSTINASNSPGATLSDQWKPLTNVDLKFAIKIGVYADSTTQNSITTTYLLPADPADYIVYDRYHFKTARRNDAITGELIFQETPVSYGPIVVKANTTTITCSNSINFSTLLSETSAQGPESIGNTPVINQKNYIVLRNGSGPTANVNVREIITVVSNNEIVVDRLPNFDNNTATFSVTSVGKLTYHGPHWYDGRWFDGSTNTFTVFKGRRSDMLRLGEVSSNSSVKFVNNIVESITINSGGTGYSNSDVITVYPVVNANTANTLHINYIPSYVNATANVITNGSGTITGIAITNAGRGLVSNTVLSIATSSGTSANLFVEVGCTLRSEIANSVYGNCVVTNVGVHRSYPHLQILTNQHHTYRLFQHYAYYTNPGFEHILNASTPAMKREVDTFKNSDTFDIQSNDGRVYVLASRSNEVAMSGNVALVVANGATVNTAIQCSSILEVDIVSNNAFSLPLVMSDDVYNYKYVINNDATDETKGSGRALARHISNKITFASNRRAEDLIVYIDAYRPAGTDVLVYAKIHNKSDTDAFDDKDWTKLQLKSNNYSTYSSLTNDKDVVEYTFGLPSVPSSVNTIAGTVTTVLNSTTITGIGTSFNTDLVVNDLVKVYSSLFDSNYMISTVKTVTNSTSIDINDAVTNNSIVSSGLKIDLLGRPRSGSNNEIGSPHQAWTNLDTDNVSRYYNLSSAKFDSYDTFQVKLVLLSNNTSIVPKINNIRAVGVSA